MKLLRALALSLLVSAGAIAQNAALMPVPRMQFFSANGVPLAGGFVYTCTAGASCPGSPLASYTDSTGLTQNANPIVLDSGGFAGIWLSGSSYKIVAQDANAVTQWTVDNVSVPGFCVISGVCSFSSLTVTGNATVGGTVVVTGATTLAAVSATSAAISGNETVGGTLGVTGATTLAGTLGVTGASTLTGNTTVGGTLGVTGAATVGSLKMLDGTGSYIARVGASSHDWQIFDTVSSTTPFTIAPSSPTNSIDVQPTYIKITNVLQFSGTNSTGAGSALLGANSPAVTLTAPYTWITVLTSDGSTGYIPIWK
jgi:hypothetical protein